MKWQDIKDIFRKEGMFFFGLGLKIENRGTQYSNDFLQL
jgi:hypothetical protein